MLPSPPAEGDLLSALLTQLRVPAVRDLAWAIGSPTLLDPGFAGFAQRVVSDPYCVCCLKRCASWLRDLNDSPTALLEFLQARPSRRLGRYFECLIEFWLRHDPAFELLVAHRCVRDRSRTLGEFDFVFRDRERVELMHWEVAVKFYLQVDGSAWEGHLAPSTIDRLDVKLTKTFGYQLELSRLPEGRVALGLGNSPIRPAAFMKGMLFYPLLEPHTEPRGISPRHLRGWWLHQSDSARLRPDRRWLPLPRLWWLAPRRLEANEQNQLWDLDCLARRLADQKAPLMLAELNLSPQGIWEETSRGFVVPAAWPKRQA
jgi:hypothetical protein